MALSLLNAAGDLYAVDSVNEILDLGLDNEVDVTNAVIGRVQEGILYVSGLSPNTTTCVLWDFLRRLRRDAKTGKPVPQTVSIYCPFKLRHHVRSILESVDSSLVPEFAHGKTRDETIVMVPQEHITEWLTKPTGHEEEDELQTAALPQRLQKNAPRRVGLKADQHILKSSSSLARASDTSPEVSSTTSSAFEQEEFLRWKQQWDIKRAHDRISRRRHQEQQQ
eukprot:gb/GECG01007480.1/.p1 GENE.gb/GECG01007480.1/~~gb/GECG01007480.1/.p1  ORF type:complete len:223 (+),score=34.13 gb/GECG01007480.1/:1-669(+)